MLKTVLEFFTGHKETDWTQEDKEACVKLLVLIMYSDDKLSDEEDQLIHRQIALFDWKGVHNEDYFLHETIRAVRDLNKNQQAVQSFVNAIAATISESEVKDKIISLCNSLTEADGEVSLKELELVKQIKSSLS